MAQDGFSLFDGNHVSDHEAGFSVPNALYRARDK